MNQISDVVVNFNVKLAEMREGFNQAVEKLTSRVSELETDLSEMNARILSLRTELAKFKGNCKARLDQTSHHLRQCESKSLQFDEKIIKLEHNINKICKDPKSLKKESAESNDMQPIQVEKQKSNYADVTVQKNRQGVDNYSVGSNDNDSSLSNINCEGVEKQIKHTVQLP